MFINLNHYKLFYISLKDTFPKLNYTFSPLVSFTSKSETDENRQRSTNIYDELYKFIGKEEIQN